MMKNSALVYVESPYQLSNAIECTRKLSVRAVNFIIRDNGNITQNQQFQNIIDVNDLTSVSVHSCPNESWLKTFFVMRLSVILMVRSWFHSVVVTGAWPSIVVTLALKWNYSNYKKIYLVDDGLYLLNMLKNIKNYPLTLVSRLPLMDYLKKSEVNRYAVKIQKQHCEDIKTIGLGVCFIGSPIVELNIFPYDLYCEVLRKIQERHYLDDLYYFAHRSESKDKLTMIERLGYKVKTPNLPLEDYLRFKGGYQGHYYSFYSTALFNLSEVVPSSSFHSIRPSPNVWPEKDRESIEDCYEFFELTKIRCLDMDLM